MSVLKTGVILQGVVLLSKFTAENLADKFY